MSTLEVSSGLVMFLKVKLTLFTDRQNVVNDKKGGSIADP